MDHGMCDCGEPLHYITDASRRIMEELVREYGETVKVSTDTGSWMVPRHWIALHGIASWELPSLAEKYRWERLR